MGESANTNAESAKSENVRASNGPNIGDKRRRARLLSSQNVVRIAGKCMRSGYEVDIAFSSPRSCA